MHSAFDAYRVRGEWFKLPPDISLAIQRFPLEDVANRVKILQPLISYAVAYGENPVLEGAVVCYTPEDPAWAKTLDAFGGHIGDKAIYSLWHKPKHWRKRKTNRKSPKPKHRRSIEAILLSGDAYQTGCKDF